MFRSRLIVLASSMVLLFGATPANAGDYFGDSPELISAATNGGHAWDMLLSGNSNFLVYTNYVANDEANTKIVIKKRSGASWSSFGEIHLTSSDFANLDSYSAMGISYDGKHILVEVDWNFKVSLLMYDYVTNETPAYWRQDPLVEFSSQYIEAPIEFSPYAAGIFLGNTSDFVLTDVLPNSTDSNKPLTTSLRAQWDERTQTWAHITEILSAPDVFWGDMNASADGNRLVLCERNLSTSSWALLEYSFTTSPATRTVIAESDSNDYYCNDISASANLNVVGFGIQSRTDQDDESFKVVVKSSTGWSSPVEIAQQSGRAVFSANGDKVLYRVGAGGSICPSQGLVYAQVSSAGFTKIADFVPATDGMVACQSVSSGTRLLISPDGKWLAGNVGANIGSYPTLRVGHVVGSSINTKTYPLLNPDTYGGDNFTWVPQLGKILVNSLHDGKWSVMAMKVATPVTGLSTRVSGTARVTKVLTAIPRSSSIPAATYSYKWYRCKSRSAAKIGQKCALIKNAAKRTYKLTKADKGKFIYVSTTARTAAGSLTKSSLATAKVAK